LAFGADYTAALRIRLTLLFGGWMSHVLVLGDSPSGDLLQALEELQLQVEQLRLQDLNEAALQRGRTVVVFLGNSRVETAIATLHRARALAPHAAIALLASLHRHEVLAALEAGADDWLSPALPAADCAIRVYALAARARRGVVPSSPWLESNAAAVAIDLANQTLNGPEGSEVITLTEARIVETIADSQVGIRATDLATLILNRKDITGRGRDAIYRHLANLRRKLGRVAPELRTLERTAVGYRLHDDVQVVRASARLHPW
jgi:DNA-binding response OmpR family regulator